MKKISVLVFVVVASLSVSAQNNQMTTPMSVKTRFGIKGGVNLAELRASGFGTTTEPKTNMKTFMNAGFLLNVPLGTKGFAIQPELVYSGQGSKLNQKTTIGTVTTSSSYEQNFTYINIPIMFQWKHQCGLFLETGPQGGYLISAKQQGPNNTENDNKNNFEKIDFAWDAGVGYLSRVGLGFNARFNYSLTNTIKDVDDPSVLRPKLKNQVIQVGLFWHFGAGK